MPASDPAYELASRALETAIKAARKADSATDHAARAYQQLRGDISRVEGKVDALILDTRETGAETRALRALITPMRAKVDSTSTELNELEKNTKPLTDAERKRARRNIAIRKWVRRLVLSAAVGAAGFLGAGLVAAAFKHCGASAPPIEVSP